MKQAIQKARTKILSPAECADKTVQEIVSEPAGPLRILFTDGCQMILVPILEFERQPEIFINTNPDPIDLINYGLLGNSYRQEILKSNLKKEQAQCEQRLKHIHNRLENLSG